MPTGKHQANTEQVARYADMLAAMGTESRLRIMQLLLTAHPEGMVVGDIAGELDIPSSTLSHHWTSSETKILCESAGTEHSFGIPQTQNRSRNSSASYMPNATTG